MHAAMITDPSATKPRVLLAEDEAPLRKAVSRALQSAGYDVTEVENGLEAVALLSKHRFDVVLTDITMPGMDGVALLRAVREKDLRVPVVLITGAPEISTATEAIQYGASEYLIKPVPLARIERSIRKAVDMGRLAELKREALHALSTGADDAGDLAGLAVTLDRALRSLWMAYQPIVDATTHALFGYEALMRSDELSLSHPSAVLSAAERLGRLPEVGQAVRSIAPAPMSEAPGPTTLFVNVHPLDLRDETLTSGKSPLASIANRVVLEVTERESLEKLGDIRPTVARLREMGYRIAIDDLGAGYAGLNSFAHLEPEFVKLDMTLVRDVHLSATKQKLVGSMTSLCRDMGITVVAEGIEVAQERDAMVELGCDLLQGFLLARPGRAFPEAQW